MVSNIGIDYVDYYLPSSRLTIDNFIEALDPQYIPNGFNDKEDYKVFCKQQLKLESISLADSLHDYEMVGRLIEHMLDTGYIKAESIDCVILAQERFNYSTENLGQYIQYTYKLKNAYVFTITGSHCSNVEMALDISKALLNTHPEANNILIISPQKIKNLNNRIIGKIAVLGDGAGIIMVKRNASGLKIVDTIKVTHGYLYDLKLNQNNTILHYRYSIESIGKLLEHNNIDAKQIKKVIVQNINSSFYSAYFKRFQLEEKLFLENIGKHGHLTCIDFLLNLKDIITTRQVNKKDLILSFGMGWAGSYLSSLLVY